MGIRMNLFLIALASMGALAQSSNDHDKDKALTVRLRPDVSVRYKNQAYPEKSVMQDRVRLGFTVDAKGAVELVGLVSTGEKFSSGWSTINDFKSGDPAKGPNLYLKRLYLQKAMGRFKAQLGALPPNKEISSSVSMDQDGWVDGARLEYYSNEGVIEIVAGSVTDLNNPDALSRKRELNFFEIEITRELFENLIFGIKAQRLKNANFLELEVKYLFPILADKVIELSAECLADVATGAKAYSVNAGFDLSSFLNQPGPRKIKANIGYLFIDERLGARGAMNNGFYTFGKVPYISISGDLNKKKTIQIFMKVFFSKEPRFDLGVKLKLQ